MRAVVVVIVVLALAVPARAADLPAADPLAAVRQALVQQSPAAAKVVFDRWLAQPDAANAPGLRARVLEAMGDHPAACAAVNRDVDASRVPGVRLRQARCSTDPGTALAAYVEVGNSVLGQDALVVDEIARFIDAHDFPLVDAVARALTLPLERFDDARRQAHAHALLTVVKRGDATQSRAALERLLTLLPETTSAKEASVSPQAQARPTQTLAQALTRANALADRHQNDDVVAAFAPFSLDGKSTLACEAQLLRAKAHRKLRKYALAQKDLAAVQNSCSDDVKKRAAYLAAKVASLGKKAESAAVLKAFATAYPNDALTDDVLEWLAESQQKSGDVKGAIATWQKLAQDFPDGDQAPEVRFRFAFALADSGDVEAARTALHDAARKAHDDPEGRDRALYWRARLGYAPQLSSWTPTANPQQKDAALAELFALATERSATFYGTLARLVVQRERPVASSTTTSPRAWRITAPSARLPVPASLQRDPAFQLARALEASGYDDEALLALAHVPVSTAAERFCVALLFDRLLAPGAAHEVLRAGGLALLAGSPSADNALAWSLDWPRAYAFAVVPAAAEAQIPEGLLFGLAREESVFDPNVVSWAGAVGLCQLMVPTAQEEARKLKLPVPDVPALKDPVLNARLGAAHLSRRLRSLGHPLLAIIAYNAGPATVAKWLTQAQPLDTFIERIPLDETRSYVKHVTNSWITYAALDGQEPVRFALDVGPRP